MFLKSDRGHRRNKRQRHLAWYFLKLASDIGENKRQRLETLAFFFKLTVEMSNKLKKWDRDIFHKSTREIRDKIGDKDM